MLATIDAPAISPEKSETLRGSIERVSRFPTVGEGIDKNPPASAWKGDWDKWENFDQWSDSHRR